MRQNMMNADRMGTDSKTAAINLPDYLTHYFYEAPFRSLTALDASAAAAMIAELAKTRTLPFRLSCAEYLPRRRAIEAQMRAAFVAKGGRVALEHPHYLILGRSTHWEQQGARSLTIPLAHFDPDVVSITYTDSYYTFFPTTLRGIPIPVKPHRGMVYRLDDLGILVQEFGLPAGYSNPEEHFDVYIEAQVWDEDVVQPFCTASPV